MLVEFHRVAVGVGHEGLAIRTDAARVLDIESSIAKLSDDHLEIVVEDGEMLSQIRRNGRLDEMELGRPEVDPGSSKPEVGSVAPNLASQHRRWR